MKQPLVFVVALAFATPAYAQLGGVLKKAQQASDAKKKADELSFTDEEERKIGADVSAKIRQRFGVAQDQAVHKYVTLVGMAVARQSERPGLDWTFIVLDTDGVNAFASPGGFVHVTRGALGLMKNEAELGAVLGHEIGHITRKHTINALRNSAAKKIGTEAAAQRGPAFIATLGNLAYDSIIENAWDRGDELDADKVSVQLMPKLGYAARSLADFLNRLSERNKSQAERNGLFASHPETKERITKVADLARASKATATVEPRYKANIKYQPTAITSVPVVTEGSAGLAGSSGPAKEQPKKEQPKKEEPKKGGGLGLGILKPTVAPEKQSSQVSASGGARGVGPDRAAKGGSNPNLVKVSVAASEITAFMKGIA